MLRTCWMLSLLSRGLEFSEQFTFFFRSLVLQKIDTVHHGLFSHLSFVTHHTPPPSSKTGLPPIDHPFPSLSSLLFPGLLVHWGFPCLIKTHYRIPSRIIRLLRFFAHSSTLQLLLTWIWMDESQRRPHVVYFPTAVRNRRPFHESYSLMQGQR